MEDQIKSKSFLVSCVGAYDDSGLGTGGFLLNHNNQNLVIDTLDCTGLYYFDGLYFRFIRSLKMLVGYDETGILYRCRFPVVNDCHDILVQQDRIVFVSTSSNEIHICDFKGKLIETISVEGSGDAWHLNCLELHNDELYIAAFGKFESHREWSDVGCYETGILYNLTKKEVTIGGLSGPHHPRYIDEKWFICDSHNKSLRVYTSSDAFETVQLGGFTRGFCFDEEHLYIGVSADRKKLDITTSKVVILDRQTYEHKGSITIPFPEVYDLVFCDDQIAEAIKKNPDTFQLYTNDAVIEGLKKQIHIGEKANRELRIQLAAKPKQTLLEKIFRKIWK